MNEKKITDLLKKYAQNEKELIIRSFKDNAYFYMSLFS